MLQSFVYAGTEAGPKFLVLGAIHGNEKCGTIGIRRVMEELGSGKLKIKRGQVTFIPICNPRAYEQDIRFTERNLNRYLVPHPVPDSYEAELGNELCPILENAEVVLDLHSYTVGGPPFASVDYKNPKEVEFAAALGSEAMISNWEEAYLATSPHSVTDPDESVGTGGYARRFGAMAVTLECGQHKDPEAPVVAYKSIRNALRYLGLTDEDKPSSVPSVPLVMVTHVYYRKDDGRFAQPLKNLQKVKKDETLAHYADGSPLNAPCDGTIVLPNANATLGSEWFYIGMEKAA